MASLKLRRVAGIVVARIYSPAELGEEQPTAGSTPQGQLVVGNTVARTLMVSSLNSIFVTHGPNEYILTLFTQVYHS